jgi:NAD(P)-dependent dehydrogenase (short-subunit alcohol dehydrogenase family)/putative sterol carrier protein
MVQAAVDETIKTFGGIDILVNNASAIRLTGTQATPMKKYDLMNQINARGTYLCSRTILPHLIESQKKGKNPHILNISPPLSMKPIWFQNHTAYTIAKYGMSMCVKGMSAELQDSGIAVNALWPKTAIITAAMEMLGGGSDGVAAQCRTPDIMADAAYAILTKPTDFTGNFVIDDKILDDEGISDFDQYAVKPGTPLILDFFLEDNDVADFHEPLKQNAAASAPEAPSSKIAGVFKNVETAITDDVVASTKGVFKFVVTGDAPETWVLDLKSKGTVTKGDGDSDVTMTLSDADFVDLFQGKLNSTSAFMQGKLKIDGNMMLAMKLESLMGAMNKAKL